MPPKLILTKDGSHSIEWAEGVTYHSTFGAIQESRHVFIREGLQILPPGRKMVQVFEMGLGTGLNALLTFLEAEARDLRVVYEAVETHPLPPVLTRELNYAELIGRRDLQEFFDRLHATDWETPVSLHPAFHFFKARRDIREYTLRRPAELVYYDAFDPVTQPELWTRDVFEHLFRQMTPGALLVTYCSKGEVRRTLQTVGFRVGKVPGPPGKREMIRAVRPK